MLLNIEKMIYGGDGLARTPADESGRSMAVFVPFVLPGEKVEAEIRREKPGFARGHVTQIVEPSAHRVAAACPYFEKCGGCHYQHIPYEQQLEFKAAIFRETFQRIAKIDLKPELQLHASPPWNYRNRTRLQVQTQPEFALAYFRLGSHALLPVRECPISSPLINRVLASMIDCGGCQYPADVEEIEFFADAEDQSLLVWAFCGRAADPKQLQLWGERLCKDIPQISGAVFFPSRRRSEEEEPADPRRLGSVGATELRYRTSSAEFCVTSGAFFQVNRHLLDDLVATVTKDVAGEIAFDLYSGVGLFSNALAKAFHHIFAVEASQISHHDLAHNGLANVKAVCARTEDYVRSVPARRRPDLVVMDPPRAGVGKSVIRSLVELGVPRIRYVSCDPATLARDLASLIGAGYRIEQAHLFDLFPQTYHIESVIVVAR